MKIMEIIPATESHLKVVNQFLQTHFFTREPLGIRFGIEPYKDTNEWLSEVTIPLLSQKVCLTLIHQTKF